MPSILRSLGMPDWLVRCAAGDIAPPEFTFDVPCRLSYGFPPALLPVWSQSSGPDYFWVWHHWFGRRQTTFVQLHVETGRITEIARTADQLRVLVVFDLLANVPDTDEVADFAGRIGLCSPHDLESYFEGYDDESDLVRHPAFAGNPPREFVTDAGDYRGDFAVDSADLSRYCSLEVPDEVVAEAVSAPAWFNSAAQPALGRSLLDAGDLEGAWFCLNSRGWLAAEMKPVLQQLAVASGENELVRLADWIAKAIPDETAY